MFLRAIFSASCLSALIFSVKTLAEQTAEDVKLKETVIEFNSETFEKEVPLKPHFVMFYAPWCGHCKRLHPIWDQLGEKYNTEIGSVTIGKVDCTQQTSVCADHEVNGYPTLKFFMTGKEVGMKYRGPRDTPSLEKFIAEQLGLEYVGAGEESENKPQGGLVDFNGAGFVHSVGDENYDAHYFIKFYAPWCGHCKRLEPTWSTLAESFEHDPLVTIGRLDCTQHKSVCSDFEVKGYPTLLWIHNGKKIAKYSGDRSHEDLKRFVVDQLGERTPLPVDEKIIPDENTKTVVVLTAENFENAIASGITFVKYFAPWCGHCKRLSPTFEELGKKFVGLEGVTIAKVDCTHDVNRELCSDQKVNGFPTLYLYKDGESVAEYNGDRSLEDMVTFITNRVDHDEL